LRAVIQDYSELGKTGEAYLTRDYGDHMKYLMPLRFNTTGALSDVKDSDAALTRGAGNEVKTVTDYRDHTALIAVLPWSAPTGGWW